MAPQPQFDPLLFGGDAETGIVAVEVTDDARGGMVAECFVRSGDTVTSRREAFKPYLIAEAEALEGCPNVADATPLTGEAPLNAVATFPSWEAYRHAVTWLTKQTGFSATHPAAPLLTINDPVQQYLMQTGKTLFLGMDMGDVRRMQVDIECLTTPGYSFCNADREGDEIVAIAMADSSGWVEVLAGTEMDEATMLERFVATVRDRDPDVLEGHNLFNFDLPYIAKRAARHGIELRLGRDGSVPTTRNSRFAAAERAIDYTRFDCYGRHIVDTLFLVHAYDISHRSLSGFGLKAAAIHFGLAAPDRTYIEGSKISDTYRASPEDVLRYVADDVIETRGISTLLSRSHFVQTQMLPYSYQNVCVRGTATRIDALMVREYLRQQQALPKPDEARRFAGGYTDMFETGVISDVHHCDVRSLYPSLMLARELAPQTDTLGVFLTMLRTLRDVRIAAKERMQAATTDTERDRYGALQSTFKVLINSFYGYLGFAQARFSDFDAAERVTAGGRELLTDMIVWMRQQGARPIEIDTDGIYFVPPPACQGDEAAAALEAFRQALIDTLPQGIEIEFDGEYRSMYSYKMKNYALLTPTGEVIIKGGALKSRGLEPFQREFMGKLVRLRLEGRDAELPELRRQYEDAIRNRDWPIEKLAKTENLQESTKTYAAKLARGDRSRAAAYELALASERDYRAGDQVSYYVTGDKKSVSVHEAARLITDWNSDKRDENVPYYLGKLDALCKKFEVPESASTQGELF